MSTLSFLPALGMGGFYSLAAPYDKLVSPTTQYRCEGVQSLSAAVADGKDPLNTVYLANGDTKANFERDLGLGVFLVTVSGAGGALIVFPVNAMLQVPSGDGIVYRNSAVVVAVGCVPETLDLTDLETEIIELVKVKLGVRASTAVVTLGSATILSQQQHEGVMAARQELITSPESLITRNAQLQDQVAAMGNRLTSLSEYIKLNIPPT